MTKTLTLVIPNFIPERHYPLFSRATKQLGACKAISILLCELFGLDTTQELPIAAITGLIEGLPTTKGFWLRADPVELRVDLATVHLLGNQHINISPLIAEKLQQQVQAFLQQDNLVLHAPHTKRWYLQLSKSAAIHTYPLDYAIAKDLYAHLPTGAEKAYWCRLFTEVQMLLHEQEIINGLWFWGAGSLPTLPVLDWQMVWTDEILTQGLARLAKISVQNIPQHFGNCLTAIQQSGNYLMVMDTLPDNIEHNWFQPILSALQTGKLHHVRVYLGNNDCYELTRLRSFQFWKN